MITHTIKDHSFPTFIFVLWSSNNFSCSRWFCFHIYIAGKNNLNWNCITYHTRTQSPIHTCVHTHLSLYSHPLTHNWHTRSQTHTLTHLLTHTHTHTNTFWSTFDSCHCIQLDLNQQTDCEFSRWIQIPPPHHHYLRFAVCRCAAVCNRLLSAAAAWSLHWTQWEKVNYSRAEPGLWGLYGKKIRTWRRLLTCSPPPRCMKGQHELHSVLLHPSRHGARLLQNCSAHTSLSLICVRFSHTLT